MGVLHINATLEAPSVVHCGAFSPSATVTRYDIKSQGHVDYAVDFHAAVSIASFSPNAAYNIYCMTTTLDGQYSMSMASIMDTRYTVVVPCCRKDLSVDVLSTVMAESLYLQDTMEVYFELDSPVLNEVQVAVEVIPISFFLMNQTVELRRRRLYSMEALELCASGVVVDPAFLSITSSTSTSLGRSIRIASRCPGTFYMNITAVEFDDNGNGNPLSITFPNDNIVEMFPKNNSAYVHNAPALLTAMFISDGQEIELRFDSSTNKAGLGGVSFICNKTIDCLESSSTLCYWKTATRLRIQQTQLLMLGDTVTLLEGVVSSEHAPTVYAAPVTRYIGSKLTLLPSVLVSSPSHVSSCARFSLDLSTSTGSGGRAWKSVSVRVKTGRSPSVDPGSPFNSDVSLVNTFFSDQYVISEATSVPTGYLIAGQIYIFQILLCNFLDKCARRDHRLEVGALPIPTVYMLGNEYRTSLRTESVRFKAAPVTYCNGTDLSSSEFKARFSPVYTWEIFNLYNETFPVLTVTRTNQFTSALSLSPYTLNSDNQYRVAVSLSLTYEGVPHTTKSSGFLSVSKGPLKSVLSTSGYISIRYGESLLLNASESFDSNMGETRDYSQLSPVVIGWDCTPLDVSTFASGCGAMTTEGASQWTLLVNSTQGGYVNSLYRIVLTVTSNLPYDTRVSTRFVDVFIEADCCTKVALVGKELVNTQEIVTVEGRISTSLNGVAVWSLVGSALDLSNIVLAPAVVNIFTFYPISTAIGTNLVIAPDSLSPGSSYVFQLVYNSNNGQDFRSATVTVTTNDIPRSGTFSVSPRSGVELKDKFFFSASSWTDDQVPLLYRFGYYAETGDENTLKVRNEDSSLEAVLPRGYPLAENASLTLDCFMTVYDKLGAFATRTRRVTVNASTLNTSELDTLYDLLANETESNTEDEPIEEVRDVYVPPVTINCSGAPDCESLNREGCSDVENTCGHCFVGNFLGVDGYANTFCYNNTISEEGVEHCFEDSSCGAFKECVDYTCNRISRTCASVCLVNGECAYRNATTGLIIDDCFVDDPTCFTFCACGTGFNGPDCDIPGIVL